MTDATTRWPDLLLAVEDWLDYLDNDEPDDPMHELTLLATLRAAAKKVREGRA